MDDTQVSVLPARTSFDAAMDDIEADLVPLPIGEHPPIPPSITVTEDLQIPIPGDPEPSQIPEQREPQVIEAPPIPPAVPVGEPPPVQVAAPVAPLPTEGGPETPNSPFRAMREAKQREKEAMAELQSARERERQLSLREEQYRLELQQLRKERDTPPADELGYVDPVEERIANLERANIALLEKSRQMEVQAYQQAMDARLVAEDTSYVPQEPGATHDQYAAARNWFIEQQVREAEVTGEIEVTATQVRQRADLPGNEKWAHEIRSKAIEMNTTEGEICRAVAKQALYNQRLGMLRAAAERRGVPVPALVWEAAHIRGWNGAPAGNGVPAVPSMPAAQSATNQLQQEQRGAVEQSLASMPTTSGAASSLLTSSGFLSMDRGKQGQLIDYMDQAAARGMVPEDWIEQLNQGVSIPVPPKLTSR